MSKSWRSLRAEPVMNQAPAGLGHAVTVSNADPSDCQDCDGVGRVWNNADETSRQFCQCKA